MVKGAKYNVESGMLNRRRGFLVRAVASVVAIWLAAWAGHRFIESLRMTAAKVQSYVESVDFSKLSGAAREKALKDLEDKLNALSYEERQKLRGERLMKDWFAEMTEEEKAQFIEATLPAGFKQMIAAFEQLPEDKRRRLIDDSMRNLRRANNSTSRGRNAPNGDTNAPPPISPELEAKIRTIGLNSFYSQSSAQTKAELAPFLEELQRQMESGRLFLRRE